MTGTVQASEEVNLRRTLVIRADIENFHHRDGHTRDTLKATQAGDTRRVAP